MKGNMETEVPKGNYDYKYAGGFADLQIRAFNTLKEAGIPIVRKPGEADVFSIIVPKTPPEVNPVFVDVNVTITYTTDTWSRFKTFTGVRIYYTGYAMSRREGFSKHMRPTWDADGKMWDFRPPDLVRKTKLAMKHAADVYDWREKRKANMAAMDGNVKKAFPTYAAIPEGGEVWDAPLSIYGNRVGIETRWGELGLQTDDGIGYTICDVEFHQHQVPISAEAIHKLIAAIDGIVQLMKAEPGG